MAVFKKGENWHIDYYVQGRRKREKIGPSKAQARTVLQKRKVEIAEGKFLDVRGRQKVKFEDMGKLFLENYSKPNKRSWRRDEEIVGHLVDFFKSKNLHEISPLDIEKYKRKRTDEVCPATVNRELSGLRNIYNRAIEWEMAQKNPIKGVKFFREDEGRLRFLEKEEIKRLYAACTAYLRPIVALAVSTGMRKGEILSLKWLDVDFRRRIITILKTKGQKRREIPVGLGISRLLLKQRKHPESPYIFCREDGRPIGSFRKAFGRALGKAGIKDFTFHDLRHTFASHLVMRGVDLRTVQEIMGHSSFRTTLRYAHLAQSHKRKAMELFDSRMDTIWTPKSEKEKVEKLPLAEVLMDEGFQLPAGVAQLVEHRPSKPMAAGSNPVPRSMVSVAQLVRALDCGSRCRGFESPRSPQQAISYRAGC